MERCENVGDAVHDGGGGKGGEDDGGGDQVDAGVELGSIAGNAESSGEGSKQEAKVGEKGVTGAFDPGNHLVHSKKGEGGSYYALDGDQGQDRLDAISFYAS